MPLDETLALIGAILSLITLVIVIVMLLTRNKYQNLNHVENTILDKVKDMETTMTKSIHESMLNFNTLVNEQLIKQSKSSSESITDLQQGFRPFPAKLEEAWCRP